MKKTNENTARNAQN